MRITSLKYFFIFIVMVYGLFFLPTDVFAQSCTNATVECGTIEEKCETNFAWECNSYMCRLFNGDCVPTGNCLPSAQISYQVACTYTSGSCQLNQSASRTCNAVGMCPVAVYGCQLISTPTPVPTPTPTSAPTCSCTTWADAGLPCGDGDCAPRQKRQSRTCSPPAGCNFETRCVLDASCSATPTPTSAPTPTPTPAPLTCNSVCTSGSECESGFCAANGRCRDRDCPTISTCVCPLACNSVCTSGSECESGFCAANGRCRDRDCPTISTCVCSTSTPTPTPTPAPSCTLSLTGATINVGGTATLTASVVPENGTVNNVSFDSSNTSKVTVSPASDSSSPYRTVATGVDPGLSTITATATMNEGTTCQATADVSVRPISCTIRLTPVTKTLGVGETQDFTADIIGVTGGTISEVTFERGNNGIRINPTSDDSEPYTTTATGFTAGSTTTLTAKGYVSGILCGSDTSVVIVPAPSCTVDLVPNTASVTMGSSLSLIANVSDIQYGTVDQVDFLSGDISKVTVNPASDNTASYSTEATGVDIGSTTVRVDVIMNGVSRCNDISDITITPPGPWWKVKDGDVETNGSIVSNIVPTGTIFIEDGLGGFPGVPIYGVSLGTGQGVISSKLWSAKTTTTQSKIFNYSYISSLIPSDVTLTDATNDSIRSSISTQYGYEWFKSSGDLTINTGSNINFLGRKVILLVNGNLTIGSNINLDDNLGFLGIFVSGNITLDPAVTQLEGIYQSNGSFNTGTGSSALWVRGSVASYGGITLARDLGVGNNVNPAETFEYAPDQAMLFPEKLSFRRTKWIEVAP